MAIGFAGIAWAGPADDAFDRAESLWEQGDLRGAVAAVVEGLSLEADNFKLNRLAGHLYYELGQFQEAYDFYSKALAKKKKDGDAIYGAGQSALKLEKFQEAAQLFERGLKARGNKARFFAGLGTAQMEQENYAEADLNLRKAIDKDEENPWYHIALGEINYRNNVFTIAITEFNKAIALDSTVEAVITDIHFKMAKSYIQQRNLEKAIEEYRKDLQLHPTDTTAWLELANICQLANNVGDAAFCFVEYLKIIPADGERWFSLGELYLSLRDQEKAAEAFEKAVSLGAREAESFGYLASIYSGRNEYERAWDAYNRYEAAIGPPDSVQYWYDKGRVAIKLGARDNAYFDTALVLFLRSAGIDSTFSSAYEYAGLAMYYKRDYAAAVPYFEKKISLDSTSVNSYRNLAFCFLKSERYSEAASVFERALVIKNEDTQMRSMLGKIYTYNEKYSNSIKHYEILLNDYSEDLTDSLRCVIYPDLGLSYLKLLKCSQAIPVLLNAEKCDPDEISILFNLASAYHACNRLDDANEYYRKVLRIDPANKEAIKGEMQTRFQGQD
jgi:tetratricopeptide (TPR) repeat protein